MCLLVIEDAVLTLDCQPFKKFGLLQTRKSQQFENREYLNETIYDIVSLKYAVKNNEGSLNDEQKVIYNQFITSVYGNESRILFLDALGRTGKTFLINLFLTKFRNTRGIVLTVASFEIIA
jgi:hypothetical protein